MHALNEAEVLRLSSPVTLDALIARHPRRTGTHALRRALEIQRQRGETVIRSDFETAFLDFAERYGLPRPQMNEPVGPTNGTPCGRTSASSSSSTATTSTRRDRASRAT